MIVMPACSWPASRRVCLDGLDLRRRRWPNSGFCVSPVLAGQARETAGRTGRCPGLARPGGLGYALFAKLLDRPDEKRCAEEKLDMAKTTFRIMQIHPFLKGEGLNPRAGGKSRLSLQLSRELAARGNDVAVFPFPEPILEKSYWLDNPGKPVRLIPTARIPAFKKLAWYFWTASQLPLTDRSPHSERLGSMFLAGLEDAVRDFQPDIIHNHLSFSDFPLLYRALRLKIPLFLTHHTHTAGQHLGSYRRIIFASDALRTLVCGRDASLLERSRLIRPAVEKIFSDPSYPVSAKRKGILFVGGLRLDKGLQNLLAAYAESAALRAVPLRICGIGPEREKFEAFAGEHKIPAAFLGRVAPETVRGEYSGAQLLVNPSPAEGFSLALAEAMCCGTPVIGWKPQVEETAKLLRMDCGFGFDPARSAPEELAELILRSVRRKNARSAACRKELAARARKFFSMERYATENLLAYEEVMEEG
jgi:glycosyltransferase involved in cell wall biosynthesis